MPTETENSRKGKDLHAAKLLLVEDDPALSELLEYRFSNEGYQVRTTSDGDEALLLACEDVPDLVILDWMIEGTSGIEVCRRLRRDKDTAHVPIIMLTAREAEDWCEVMACSMQLKGIAVSHADKRCQCA